MYTVLVAQGPYATSLYATRTKSPPSSYTNSLLSKLPEGAVWYHLLSEGGLLCESFLFLYHLSLILLLLLLSFIAIKLFLSQPEIFTFCASSPSCCCGKGERKAGKRENGHGLEGLSGDTEQGKTIPNPQQILVHSPPMLPWYPGPQCYQCALIWAPSPPSAQCFWLPVLLLPSVSSILSAQWQDSSSSIRTTALSTTHQYWDPSHATSTPGPSIGTPGPSISTPAPASVPQSQAPLCSPEPPPSPSLAPSPLPAPLSW